MYDVFDGFLAVDTWHTGHHYDLQRFYKALHQVVADDDFSPEKMGDYMRQKKGIHNSPNSPFHEDIDNLVRKAGVVQDYLAAI